MPTALSSTTSRYQSPAWLPNRHIQTIYAAQLAPKQKIDYRRERWSSPDGDFIDIDFTVQPVASDAPLFVLFHGLEGCSLSHYARAFMNMASNHRWQGAVAHFRGCSGEINHGPRAYHSGDSDEINWVLQRFADEHINRPRFAAGVSLGGNALAKWIGLNGERAKQVISRAATISAPHDLHAGCLALSHGFSRVYTANFMKTLKRKSLIKLDQFPGLFDKEKMLASKSFFDFDDAVTAPVHGFDSCYDYWSKSSCAQFLPDVALPLLVLNARNDPFVPEHTLTSPQQVSRHVQLEYPEDGGHVGFIHGKPPGSLNWLSQRLHDWFTLDGALDHG